MIGRNPKKRIYKKQFFFLFLPNILFLCFFRETIILSFIRKKEFIIIFNIDF